MPQVNCKVQQAVVGQDSRLAISGNPNSLGYFNAAAVQDA
jgi:hypothetical protein